MTSVSFDGTLRKWNTNSMQMEGMYKDKRIGTKSEISEILFFSVVFISVLSGLGGLKN